MACDQIRPSQILATVVVVGLEGAGLILDDDRLEHALAIAEEEIDVRKALGDYYATDPRALTTKGLAALIVDALIVAGIVRTESFDSAIAIASEEIDARKALNDY